MGGAIFTVALAILIFADLAFFKIVFDTIRHDRLEAD